MKISKLFHWLYGFVMLLPIFAIGTTCLINTFNMQVKAEQEIIYKYDTNEVNTIGDLKVGNIYHMNITCNFDNDNTLRRIEFTEWYNFDYSQFTIQANSNPADMLVTPCLQKVSSGNWYFHAWRTNSNLIYFGVTNYNIEFDFVYKTQTNFDIYLDSISKCTEIPIESTQTTDTKNIFYDSVDKVTESPLFSWAYDSFLVAPFAYIVNLFGMPTNSVIVELLSYWLAISIIWLVFDLVMYVPLLVHRWLDKGVLE